MSSAEIRLYMLMIVMLSMAVHEIQGLECVSDFCNSVDCAPDIQCGIGFTAVDNAGDCGCCPACVQVLGEGSECSSGPYADPANSVGTYTWHGYQPVCDNGLYCNTTVTPYICSQAVSCGPDACERTDGSACPMYFCASGYKLVPNADQCGCCHACIKALDEGSDCFSAPYPFPAGETSVWYPNKRVCDSGLYCAESHMAAVCKQGVTCGPDACERSDGSLCPSLLCIPGYTPVPNADQCGCCSACVELLAEGSECSSAPYASTNPDGSYIWFGYQPVCDNGLYCDTTVPTPVCKQGITCGADACERSDGSACPSLLCILGYKPVPNADQCGCCSACVEQLDEGSDCFQVQYPFLANQDGSYIWYANARVCSDGLYCAESHMAAVCKKGQECESDFCAVIECAMVNCGPGFVAVNNAGDCGCCPACVPTLAEGSECSSDAYASPPNSDGMYIWHGSQPVCDNGLYCDTTVSTPVCRQGITCGADACVRSDGSVCPSLLCIPGYTPVPNADQCGCCTACIESLDEGSDCLAVAYPFPPADDGSYIWYANARVCDNGLYCAGNHISSVCRQDDCVSRRTEALSMMRPGRYVPQCNPDGSYKAKQCGPGPECHCVDDQNVKVGQYSAPSWQAENMDCLCAREKHRSQDGTMQCTELGNFPSVVIFAAGQNRAFSHESMTSLLIVMACLCLLFINE